MRYPSFKRLPSLALLLGLAAAIAFPHQAHAQSTSVEVWLRAFIPDPQHAGPAAAQIVPNPTGAGSMVLLHAATPALPNLCFATDHRGFDSTSSSTARLETRFSLQQQGATARVTAGPRTTASVTRKLSCTAGTLLQQMAGSVDRDHLGAPAVAAGTVQVIGQAQGRNLLTPAGALGPAIDYSFDLQWTPKTATLKASLTYGSFPAFEVYARQPGGPWVTVLRQLPTGAPWQLAGSGFGLNTLNQVVTVNVAGANGVWESQSPAPARRFALEISWGKAVWSETNATGTVLAREVALEELPNGTFRIQRPNDAEVLAFLGYQSSLRAEILARNPQPSFMILSLDGANVRAEWNGLFVTKDANARLKDLFQPGTRPFTPFTFTRRLRT